MKKTILLLLLTFFCWQVSFANDTIQEKIDLTPKIKKGDSWNMVFTIEHESLNLSHNPLEMDDGYRKTDWSVECIDSSKDKLILKFSLDRMIRKWKIDHNFCFNDTDYPLNLSNESQSKTKQILGKTIVCEIPWHTNKDVKILKNEFTNLSIDFPIKNFSDRNGSRNFYCTYSTASYTSALPAAITSILKLWQISIPENSTALGENWEAEIEEKEARTKFKLQLKSYDETSARIELESNNEKNSIIINRKNGSLFTTGDLTNFKTYSYNTESSNTIVTGNYKNTELNGEANFDIEFPIQQGKLKVEVQNGKFKMPLDLKNSVYGTLTFKDYKTKLFLRPGMNINIDWDDQTAKASGFGAQDVNSVLQFQAIPFYYDYNSQKYSKQDIIEKTKTYQNKVKKILHQYETSISADCKKFIQTESKYRIASWHISSLGDLEREKIFRKIDNEEFDFKKANENSKYFLNHLDSLQPHGKIDPCSPLYHQFLVEFIELKQSFFLYERGRRYNAANFKENILFAGMQYMGYPYYYSVYKLLESEILTGNNSIIKDELEDFKLLPGNTALSNALDGTIQEMNYIENGNPFPFSEITDMDGKKHTIPKNEFSIIDIATIYGMDKNREKEEVTRILQSKDKINKINYIIIRPHFAKGGTKEATSCDTVNFTYIYLSKKDSEYFSKFKLLDRRRTLLLNKKHIILGNNVGDIQKNTSNKLNQLLDDYFDSLNQPISKADNSRLWLVLLSSIIGFGALSLLVIRIRSKQIATREETRRKITELELKAIRSQMNPHFIFNALGSIQNLINHNNSKKANLYLSRFARLMRMVLNNSNQQLITLAHELDLLKHYLELEQLRVDFKFNIDIADNIDPETEEIPGMLIQPFVENAVIHGITPIGEGNVNVNFTKNNGVLQCEITDDGIGINASKNTSGNGLAMKLSEDRLNLLNSQLNTQLRLKVEDRLEIEQTKGTKISLTIPVE